MQIVDINDSTREVQSVAPDPEYPGYVRVEFRRHHEWYTITEFIQKNPSLKHLTQSAKAVPTDFVGTVSSSGTDYIKDATQNWPENAYSGFFVWISRGKGEGQKRTVLKNDHKTIFVDSPWETKPNKTSQYVLSFNVKTVHAMGNTLPQEDFKALEKRALEIDKQHGKLSSANIKKNIKFLKLDEI